MRLPLVNPDDQTSIDIERFKAMADKFIERGFTYFDTAYPYHGGKSEEALREAVVKRYPRESFTVTSKMPVWAIKEEADLERIFNEQLERCGVDYFDYYWLHALNRERVAAIDSYDGWGFLVRKRDEGRIRHIGFSFHDGSSLLAEILDKHPEMEYVQLQINYLDWDSPAIESRTCYELCEKHGKPYWIDNPEHPIETDRGLEFLYWIEAEFGDRGIVLNVAGPRESKEAGIQAATRSFVKRILSEPCVSNAPHVKATRDETEEAST